jgi:hypothetical protein
MFPVAKETILNGVLLNYEDLLVAGENLA